MVSPVLSKILLSCSILSVSSVSSVVFAEPNSVVTIPLSVYEEYLSLKMGPIVGVISDVSVEGSLASGKLNFSLKGKFSGTAQAIDLMNIPKKSKLGSCEGNAMVYRNEDSYALLPRAPDFSVRCVLSFDTSDMLVLSFSNKVIHVSTKISDSSVLETEDGGGSLNLVLQKKRSNNIRTEATSGKVLVLARYLVTAMPDGTRVHYRFSIDNPNVESKMLSVPLLNQEVLGKIVTPLVYGIENENLTIKAPPGTSEFEAFGQILAQNFRPLFDSEEQYAVLEFHPLVAIELKRGAKRVTLEQTGIESTYKAALGFLLNSQESLEWTAKTREVFSAKSYAAKNASYQLWIPARGLPLVDTTWDLTNQGEPSLELAIPGAAYFAATNGEPQLLAKTKNQALFVPLASGNTSVRLQYAPQNRANDWFGLWQTNLVKPNVDIPSGTLELRVDHKYKVVATQFLGRFELPWFNPIRLLVAFVLSVFVFLWLQKSIGLARWSSAMLGLFVLCLAIFYWCVVAVAFCSFIALYFIRYRRLIVDKIFLLWRERQFFKLALLFGVFSAIIFLGISFALFTDSLNLSDRVEYSRVPNYASKLAESVPTEGRNLEASALGIGGLGFSGHLQPKKRDEEDDSLLGLPVAHVIPTNNQWFMLEENAIEASLTCPVRVFLVGIKGMWVISFFLLALLIIPLWTCRWTFQKWVLNER